MQAVTTIGLDIAKSVFQVHGVDAAGQVLIRRQLKRRVVLGFFQKLPVCLVGIEACASSHYWSRELQALGHSVRLMPPAYVKPYVKRQKNDMAGKHFEGWEATRIARQRPLLGRREAVGGGIHFSAFSIPPYADSTWGLTQSIPADQNRCPSGSTSHQRPSRFCVRK